MTAKKRTFDGNAVDKFMSTGNNANTEQKPRQRNTKKNGDYVRTNLSLSTEKNDFLRIMAKAKGVSITQYVEDLLDEKMKEAGSKYEQIKQLLDEI